MKATRAKRKGDNWPRALHRFAETANRSGFLFTQFRTENRCHFSWNCSSGDRASAAYRSAAGWRKDREIARPPDSQRPTMLPPEALAVTAACCSALSSMFLSELKGRVPLLQLARWQMLA